MSFVLTKLAIDLDGGLSPCEKAALVVICSHSGDDGTGAFPSTGTIARKTGFNERTVRVAIRGLVDAKLISTTQDAGGKRYFIVSVAMLEGGQKVTGGQETAGGQKATVHPGRKLPPSPGRKLPPNISNVTNTGINPSSTSPVGDVAPSPEFSLSGDAPQPRKNGIPPCPYQRVVDSYNQILGDLLPGVRFLTDKRKPKIKNLWAFVYKLCECENEDEGVTAMGLYFNRIKNTPFLLGQNNSSSHPNWRANFDFILREDVRTRLLEGGYK